MRKQLERGRSQKVYDRSTHPPGPQRPAPPSASATEVWDQVEALVVQEKPQSAVTASPPASEASSKRVRGTARKTRRMKRRIRLLDGIAVVVWLAMLTKLFVADVDRFLLDSVWPQAVWILDLRWAIALILIALMLALFKRRTLAMAFAYVAAYPAVILLWKLPKFLLARRSRTLTFAVANGLASAVVHARRFVSTLAVTVLSVLLITMSQTAWLIAMGAGALLTTLGWTVVVGMGDLVRSSRFLTAQHKAIAWLVDSDVLDRLLTPKHPSKVAIKDWTVVDAKAYRDAAGITVLVRRTLTFWAYVIDEYRRGPVILLAGVGLLVGLLAQVAFAFSFITYAIFTIDPSQYVFTEPPQWWTFLNYSVTSMYFGEIGALQAVGVIAVIARLLTGVLGVVVIGTVGTGVLLAYRAARDTHETTGAVRLLEDKGDEVDRLAVDDYKLDIDALESKLAATAWDLLTVAKWLRNQMPLASGRSPVDLQRDASKEPVGAHSSPTGR